MVLSVRLSSVTDGPAPRHPDGTSFTSCPNLREAAKPHQRKRRRTGHPCGPGPCRPGRLRPASGRRGLGSRRGGDAPQGRPVAAVEHPGLGATRGAGVARGTGPGRVGHGEAKQARQACVVSAQPSLSPPSLGWAQGMQVAAGGASVTPQPSPHFYSAGPVPDPGSPWPPPALARSAAHSGCAPWGAVLHDRGVGSHAASSSRPLPGSPIASCLRGRGFGVVSPHA